MHRLSCAGLPREPLHDLTGRTVDLSPVVGRHERVPLENHGRLERVRAIRSRQRLTYQGVNALIREHGQGHVESPRRCAYTRDRAGCQV